jgi:hypothetical protein
VREVVVSYLQAKQVWKPSAAYAGAAARNDPDAMEIGQIGHGKGKGKGKDGNGKAGKKGKEKKTKGTSKDSHSSGKSGKSSDSKDRCAICWKTGHTTEKCWFNSKGREKGKGKKFVSAVAEGDTSSVISAGPSASQVGGNSIYHHHSPPSTQYKQQKSVGKIGEHRLLMVKAVQELQSSIKSAESTLAEQGKVSQLETTLANPEGENLQPSDAILALNDRRGWHDLSLDTKVYVTKGRSGRKKKVCDSRTSVS